MSVKYDVATSTSSPARFNFFLTITILFYLFSYSFYSVFFDKHALSSLPRSTVQLIERFSQILLLNPCHLSPSISSPLFPFKYSCR
mmetsp:Transcript_32972/g.33387  ORF Transcript_32972/g.33387 Transcript_32972/m.33387 type:complete len:86 (-) Transcript_32972:59-316(-)